MNQHSACPVCASPALSPIGTRTLELREPPPTIQQGEGNAILKRVLASRSQATVTLLCRSCRHLFVSPTFDEAELARLYSPECVAEVKHQYRESERCSGRSWAEQNRIPAGAQESFLAEARTYRPKRLHEVVMKAMAPGNLRRILDFGARTGELTERFAGDGQRFVYDRDLSEVSSPAVIPLASFAAVQANGPYDLIVLSHVLEHVPFPTRLLAELRDLLSPGGVIYIEVPLEYCGALIKRRGFPLGPHVDFFCRSSLRACLASASLTGLSLLREIAPYGECQGPVLKAVAARSGRNRGRAWQWPWPLELSVDLALTLRARFWRRRFR